MKKLLLLAAILLLPLFAQAQFGNTTTINFAGVPTGSCSFLIFAINGATGDLYNCLSGSWNLVGGAGASMAFSAITGGTNSSAAMVLGTGSSLTVSGSGTNNATSLGGTAAASYALLASPSFTTPTLGAATATTINKYTFTQPASAATLTILNNKTFAVNNSLTLAGTDSTTLTFPGTSDTIPGLGTAEQFTAQQLLPGNVSYVCSAGGTGCGATPGDFTSANASGLQSITGLVVGPLPASQTAKVHFRCEIVYNQATGSAADQFGVVNSVAPTLELVIAMAQTAASTFQGNTASITSTTATSAVQFTAPSGTNEIAWLEGFINQPSGSANTMNVQVTNGTAANVIIVRNGSSCTWN